MQTKWKVEKTCHLERQLDKNVTLQTSVFTIMLHKLWGKRYGVTIRNINGINHNFDLYTSKCILGPKVMIAYS